MPDTPKPRTPTQEVSEDIALKLYELHLQVNTVVWMLRDGYQKEAAPLGTIEGIDRRPMEFRQAEMWVSSAELLLEQAHQLMDGFAQGRVNPLTGG